MIILAVDECSNFNKGVKMKLQIKDFCTIKTGYSFRGQVAEDKNGNFYLLQAKDINAFGEINYQQCIKISTDNIKHITSLNQGEIVFTARGNFKAALFKSNKQFTTSNAIFILNVDSKVCTNNYLAIWLNSPACKKQLDKVTLLSATTPTLPRKALDDLIVYLPNIDRQEEIAKLYRLNSKKFMLQQEIYNVRKIQLENLMNGEMI